MSFERKLRPGTFIYEIESGMLQVGSSPQHAVLLSSLSPTEMAWVKDLAAPPPLSSREKNTQGRTTRVPRGTAWKNHEKEPPTAGDEPELSARQAEILRLLDAVGLLHEEMHPLQRLDVRVMGLDRVGTRIALLLASAGVHGLELQDRRLVDAHVEDLYPSADAGLPRTRALGNEIRRIHPRVRVGRLSMPDLVIVSDERVWDHGVLGLLLSEDVTHLPVIQEDRSITVGPLVAPGVSACALCVDMHIHDVLPEWPKMALTLSQTELPSVPDHLTAAAAGLAVTMVEAIALGVPLLNDGSALGTKGAPSQSWRVSQSGVHTDLWTPHPRCTCSTGLLGRTSHPIAG